MNLLPSRGKQTINIGGLNDGTECVDSEAC